jgi:hypothetical protein
VGAGLLRSSLGGRGSTPRVSICRCHGVDTRDRAWQVQSTAQELFAEAVGAKQTRFSTNGSSMSVRVAIMTVAGPGDVLVMARNGHKSSFAGLVLSGAPPRYVDPYYDTARAPRGTVLGPLHLDLLGLVVDLNQVHLTITGNPAGGILGRLLCGLANAPTPTIPGSTAADRAPPRRHENRRARVGECPPEALGHPPGAIASLPGTRQRGHSAVARGRRWEAGLTLTTGCRAARA